MVMSDERTPIYQSLVDGTGMNPEPDPFPWVSPLHGRISQEDWERPGDWARAQKIATFEYRPRVIGLCGEWGHDDIWCVDEREPEIYYCPDCNTEFGPYFH